jgi:hypothetical protein
MEHADLICVPQLMSGEQALAAQIGSARVPRSVSATLRRRWVIRTARSDVALR